MSSQLQLMALEGLPLIKAGDDLPQIINTALVKHDLNVEDGDILVLAQKIISKSEGRMVKLDSVTPGSDAQRLAMEVNKDPRLVELILSESRAVIRKKPGVLITENRLGWIMANAGIDASNVGNDEQVLLLPIDSDHSCANIRSALIAHWKVSVGVIVNDSFGRPWRRGTAGIALGAAGVPVLWDRSGDLDLFGRELKSTCPAIADELAAAASLLQGQGNEGRPIVLIRGLRLDAGKEIPFLPATALQRAESEDMFR